MSRGSTVNTKTLGRKDQDDIGDTGRKFAYQATTSWSHDDNNVPDDRLQKTKQRGME